MPFLRHTLRGHLAEIIEVDVSLDNHLLVSVDAECALVVWCLRTGQPLVSFRGSRLNRVISGLTFVAAPSTGDENSPVTSGWLLVSSYGCGIHFIPYTHTRVCCEADRMGGEFVDKCCSLELHPTINFSTFEPEIAQSANAVVLDVSPGAFVLVVFTLMIEHVSHLLCNLLLYVALY